MSFFRLPWAIVMGAVSCPCRTLGGGTPFCSLSPLANQSFHLAGITAGTAGPGLGRFPTLRLGCARLAGVCCLKIFLTRGLQIRSSSDRLCDPWTRLRAVLVLMLALVGAGKSFWGRPLVGRVVTGE